MINSHYVPRLILRKFSDRLSLYNVKTGELKENIPIEHAYAIEDYVSAFNFYIELESAYALTLAVVLTCTKNGRFIK